MDKDTIYRQDAIDALHYEIVRRRVDEDTNDDGALDEFDTEAILRQLPSAQPEIVRCGQCKYAEIADAQDKQDGYTCQFHRGSIWFSGSYCSWAERRTDG